MCTVIRRPASTVFDPFSGENGVAKPRRASPADALVEAAGNCAATPFVVIDPVAVGVAFHVSEELEPCIQNVFLSALGEGDIRHGNLFYNTRRQHWVSGVGGECSSPAPVTLLQ